MDNTVYQDHSTHPKISQEIINSHLAGITDDSALLNPYTVELLQPTAWKMAKAATKPGGLVRLRWVSAITGAISEVMLFAPPPAVKPLIIKDSSGTHYALMFGSQGVESHKGTWLWKVLKESTLADYKRRIQEVEKRGSPGGQLIIDSLTRHMAHWIGEEEVL